ncbi:MAG: hypothetical protein M3237_22520 [Actinomycetota bacterium]|nr:hypothetical protein [Actinomycetota bacterium]
MNRSTLRRSATSAVAVLALATLAACGGDDEGDGDATSSESGGTTDAVDPEASESAVDGDDPHPADGAGEEIEPDEFLDVYVEAMDRATTATLTMRFADTAGVEGRGSADFTTTPPSMDLVIAGSGTGPEQRMVIVDGKAYLGISDEQYVEYDLNDPDSPLGNLTDRLDPRAMVDVFEEGITRSAYVGEETVAGESMEHYALTLDASALLDAADLPQGAPSPEAEQIDFDLWFDDGGLVRRQEAGLGGAVGRIELTYDNWGAPVEIKAPPESQISRPPTQG